MNVPSILAKWFESFGYKNFKFVRNNGKYLLTYTVGTNPNPITVFGYRDGYYNFHSEPFTISLKEMQELKETEILDRFIQKFGGKNLIKLFTITPEFVEFVRFPKDILELEVEMVARW